MNYELVIIVSSGIEVEKQTKAIKDLETVIVNLQGKVSKTDNWGKKELSYKIRGNTFGIFVSYNISLDPGKIKDLEKKIKSNDGIIRYLLIKQRS